MNKYLTGDITWFLPNPPSTQPWPPRTWTRGIWRWWHRQQRLNAHEYVKAFSDALLNGCGFMRYDESGTHHVPYREVRIK